MLQTPSAADTPSAARRVTRLDAAGTRSLDVFGAAAGLLLLSPVLLAVAVIIRLTSPGPALFRSTRVGRNARPFTLYKFRSMADQAHGSGPAITSAEDPRITPIGGTLRRLKLDELPQLLNVLRGDMSLVGPRPEDPAYVSLYSREQLAVLSAKPGMTSPASLRYRDEAAELVGERWEDHYIADVMPTKLAIDCDYLSDRTAWSDLKVIFRTIAALATSRPGR